MILVFCLEAKDPWSPCRPSKLPFLQIRPSGSGFCFGAWGLQVSGKLNLAHRKLQLVREGEIMGETPFKWTSDEWVTIRIQREKVDENPDSWIIKVKAWQGDESADWPIVLESDLKQSAGKCSVWGAPYSTKPIHIDDITVFSASPLGTP